METSIYCQIPDWQLSKVEYIQRMKSHHSASGCKNTFAVYVQQYQNYFNAPIINSNTFYTIWAAVEAKPYSERTYVPYVPTHCRTYIDNNKVLRNDLENKVMLITRDSIHASFANREGKIETWGIDLFTQSYLALGNDFSELDPLSWSE